MKTIERKVSDAGRTTYREVVSNIGTVTKREIVSYKCIAAKKVDELVENGEAQVFDYDTKERKFQTEIGKKFFAFITATTAKEGVTCTYMNCFTEWPEVVGDMVGAKDYERNLGGHVEDADGSIIATFDGEGNYEVVAVNAATEGLLDEVEELAYQYYINENDAEKQQEAAHELNAVEEEILEVHRHGGESISVALELIDERREDGRERANAEKAAVSEKVEEGGEAVIYIDDKGIEYSVAPVTGRNSWLRDDLDGLEGQAFIVCRLGDVPLEGVAPRHSMAKAEQDLEELAQKNGWFAA